MKIAFVGNCQFESLAWYFKYLLPNDECWWISWHERYGGYNFQAKLNEVNHEFFTKDFISNVRCPYNSIDYIKSCDYVIYLKMRKHGSPNYHTEKLKTYFNDKCKTLSVTSYYINTDKYNETLKGTIKREKERNTEMRIDQIINQHNKNEMLPRRQHEPNHPPSNYFLKLIELICERFDWQYFSKKDHDMFLKTGFPHGVNLT
jgi:hypothetical protein